MCFYNTTIDIGIRITHQDITIRGEKEAEGRNDSKGEYKTYTTFFKSIIYAVIRIRPCISLFWVINPLFIEFLFKDLY